MRQRQHWRWARRAVILFFLLIAAPLGLVTFVHAKTSDQRYSSPLKLPAKPVALVFGAGVYRNGQLSPMLQARVQRAVELYQLGRVQKILMSGDNSRKDYDEVSAMERYARALGVPAADIARDHAGFSTYESCYRARDIFGVREAVLITQAYHLPRAVYTCEQLGLQVVGLATDDVGRYPAMIMRKYKFREAFAIAKAWWDVEIAQPRPTFLGPFEGLE